MCDTRWRVPQLTEEIGKTSMTHFEDHHNGCGAHGLCQLSSKIDILVSSPGRLVKHLEQVHCTSPCPGTTVPCILCTLLCYCDKIFQSVLTCDCVSSVCVDRCSAQCVPAGCELCRDRRSGHHAHAGLRRRHQVGVRGREMI